MSPNPYAAPAPSSSGAFREVAPASVPADARTVNVVETDPKQVLPWRFAFGRGEVWIVTPEGDRAFAATHAELAANASHLITSGFVALSLTGIPGRKNLLLRFQGDALAALRSWMAEDLPTHLRAALKKSQRAAMPIGLFLTVLAFVGTTTDWLTVTIGVGMIGASLLGRRYPRPWVYLVDAAVWVLYAGSCARSIAASGSKLSMALGALMLFFAYNSVRRYGFFNARA